MWIRRARTHRSRPLPGPLQTVLNATQGAVEGFDLASYQRAHVVLVGAGGIGSAVATALVRKGIGHLDVIDADRVEPANLTRQYFDRDDIGKLKAVQLAKHLARDGLFKTGITARPLSFQELTERGHNFGTASLVICGVDNNPSRRAVTRHALMHRLPVIHAAVGRDANGISVMVQEPDKACWGCAFPAALNDDTYPCHVPAIIDVLQVVAGIVVYAADTILCRRHREWNVRELTLDGGFPDRARVVERRPDCPLCRNSSLPPPPPIRVWWRLRKH